MTGATGQLRWTWVPCILYLLLGVAVLLLLPYAVYTTKDKQMGSGASGGSGLAYAAVAEAILFGGWSVTVLIMNAHQKCAHPFTQCCSIVGNPLSMALIVGSTVFIAFSNWGYEEGTGSPGYNAMQRDIEARKAEAARLTTVAIVGGSIAATLCLVLSIYSCVGYKFLRRARRRVAIELHDQTTSVQLQPAKTR